MGELWHRRVKRFDKDQKERLASPGKSHSSKLTWILVGALILVILFYIIR